MNAFRSMLPVLIATTKGKLQIAHSLQTRVRYIVIATRLYENSKLVSLEKTVTYTLMILDLSLSKLWA